MIRLSGIAIALAAAALTACNNEDHNIVAGGPADDQAEALRNAAPVELPPMIVSSMAYRCKDNSLVYVEFFNDSKTANLRQSKDGPVTALTAPEPGKPYTSGAYSVTGKPGDKAITVAQPGKPAESCKAA